MEPLTLFQASAGDRLDHRLHAGQLSYRLYGDGDGSALTQTHACLREVLLPPHTAAHAIQTTLWSNKTLDKTVLHLFLYKF